MAISSHIWQCQSIYGNISLYMAVSGHKMTIFCHYMAILGHIKINMATSGHVKINTTKTGDDMAT